MLKLSLIFILIVGNMLYGQESEYRSISKMDIKSEFQKDIDTTDNSRLARFWKKAKPKDKEEIRSHILEQKKDIEMDTSNVTKIFYLGIKEKVRLKIDGTFLKPTATFTEYNYQSFSGDSIFKIYLGTIPRYTELENVELIFENLKRKANIQIDTKYSLIHIETEHIENLAEILKRETAVEKNIKKLKKSGQKSKAPDKIEVIEKEAVRVKHKIPSRKRN